MSSLFSLTFYRLRKIAINYYLIIGLNIIHLYCPISKQSKIQVTLEMLCKQNEVNQQTQVLETITQPEKYL